jgi:hypothetical protein
MVTTFTLDLQADFTPFVRSNQDIANQAVLEVSDRLLYDIENNRAPYRHGPLDSRLVRDAVNDLTILQFKTYSISGHIE